MGQKTFNTTRLNQTGTQKDNMKQAQPENKTASGIAPKVRVMADIEYLDGTLAGMTIPFGYSVSYSTQSEAERASRWIEKVIRENDFVRATGTGNRYQFKSCPVIV